MLEHLKWFYFILLADLKDFSSVSFWFMQAGTVQSNKRHANTWVKMPEQGKWLHFFSLKSPGQGYLNYINNNSTNKKKP